MLERYAPNLRTRIPSLHLEGVPLEEALHVISKRGGLGLIYGGETLAGGGKVTLKLEDATVLEALHAALQERLMLEQQAPNTNASLLRNIELTAGNFEPHMVLGPIPASEILLNPNLVQNPGY